MTANQAVYFVKQLFKISANNMERASKPTESMPHSELRIQCSNPHCKASNDLESRFCRQCKTPVVKRYLWAMGAKSHSSEASITILHQIGVEQVGKLIGERYLALTQQIFLDTKPGLIPQIPEEIPPEISHYLQLFSQYPHVPQVYGQLNNHNIWLLDYGTVPTNQVGQLKYPEQLVPEITSLWLDANPIRQLNWLRQIANLWKPLAEKNAVSTLLNSFLIRVNGPLVQLIEVTLDGETSPNLKDLGKLWREWSENADPTIKDILEQLSLRLERGSVVKIEQVIAVLDRALDLHSQSQDYFYQVFACSDPGPTRSNNEDAAYPDSSTPLQLSRDQTTLAIVCDGVGGHDGGEIAAQETINYLRTSVGEMSFEKDQNSSATVFKQLVKFTNSANDAICDRNDHEKRHERQRMGTTLVMAVARNHEVYLTHVGDSRIYLITSEGCHQVTIDDDLASREVRLGYAVYRDAVQYPSAGALIQALGMRSSNALHPNVQRLVMDQDCVFLLCTDGLSDFDRVEQYWRDTVLPMLNGQSNITKAVKTLVKISNERNGHDNATVALVHCQVKPKLSTPKISCLWSDVESAISDSILWSDIHVDTSPLPSTEPVTEIPQSLPTEQIIADNQKPFPSLVAFLVGLAVLIALGASVYWYVELQKRVEQQKDSYNNEDSEQVESSPQEPLEPIITQ